MTRVASDDAAIPAGDSPLALLQGQLERAEAALVAEQNARAAEQSARAAEAADAGEMLARAARTDERARVAEEAVERAVAEAEAQRRVAAELEENVARIWRELGTVRRELEQRTEQLHKAEATALEKSRGSELAVQELENKLRAAEAAPPPAAAGPPAPVTPASVATAKDSVEDSSADDVATLRAKLEEARAETRRMRENFEMLQTRAGKIGAGLREMRELMVQSAALFDDLEEREKAIGEIRAKSMREARGLFLRAAGKDHEVGRPPPLPSEKAPVEDLSEAAELLEEEVRSSMRPPAARGGPDDERSGG
jgi:colicin import membrane protein